MHVVSTVYIVYIYFETHGLENTFKSSRLIGLIAKVIKDDQST